MLTRWLAAGCAVAGVTVLAGPGWALLSAALILAVLPEPRSLAILAARVRGVAVGVREKTRVVRARGAGRRAVAQGQMAAALILGPLGMIVWVGVGAGLVVAAAGLAVLSLHLGWNA
jgi:hypothetical protein